MDYLHQLNKNFKTFASSIAIQDAETSLSYAELGQLTAHIKAALSTTGVPANSYVGIYFDSKPLAIASIIAILEHGCAYIPLDPIYPAERLAYMLDNASAKYLLCDTACHFAGDTIQAINVKDLVSKAAIDSSPSSSNPAIMPTQAAYLIYTSGSTGKPKGVMMPHGVLNALIDWQNKHYDQDYRPKTLQFSSLSFDVSFQEIFSTLSLGGTLFTLSHELKQDFKSLAEFIIAHHIERIFMPYVALKNLMQWFVRLKTQPNALKEVITAGEQLIITEDIRQVFSQLSKTTLSNQYGPSESHVVSEYILEGPAATWPEIPPIGQALDHAQLYILNEQQKPVEAGEVGELFIAGPVLALGYVNNTQETEKRFLSLELEGENRLCYRTGDLVYQDNRAQLHYSGRVDSQVKLSGYRIELSEIEAVLMKYSHVDNAAVGVFDKNGQKSLAAFIVMTNAASSNIASPNTELNDLKALVSQELPAYMQPAHYERVESLLTTPSGKIDRKTMLEQLSAKLDRSFKDGLEDSVKDSLKNSLNDDLELKENMELANQEAQAKPSQINQQAILALIHHLLGTKDIDSSTSLVDAGMSSLMANQLSLKLFEQFDLDIPAYKLFQFASIDAFIQSICDKKTSIQHQSKRSSQAHQSRDIAIIGMAVNVPGATNLEQFWRNLREGKESLHSFSPTTASVEVNTRGIIAAPLALDAGFFGITPTEAEFIDPQQRVLLELAWQALEDAGTLPEEFPGRIGVFCGTGNNSYYLENVLKNPEKLDEYGALQAMIANEKDYTATRIAHKLNLNGPAINIQTACSTSLVAVCQAVEALRSGECEIAIAGGASITFPQAQPHTPEEGSIKSHDGHTRPFDKLANGTVFSDGGGLIVLKRLDYAEQDNDRICAVIKGVATNNDGAQKGSFSAPSEEGQKNVILMAQQDAGIQADNVSYIEAHGTATPIGDPIEVAALCAAFKENSNTGQSQCQLGSVKSNLGHLTAAAGVIGLIKSALAVEKGEIPPSINFSEANPELRLEATPFSICQTLTQWQQPVLSRYAGVSSFGIGGTNAHAVIAGYEPPASLNESDAKHLNEADDALLPLCISAKSRESLSLQLKSMEAYLQQHPDICIAHLKQSYCLHRQALPFRVAVFGSTPAELIEAIQQVELPEQAISKTPTVVYVFPGQGTQVNGMGKELYQNLPLVKKHLDQCIAICAQTHQLDLKHLLFSDDPSLNLTENTQIALFSIGYSVASVLNELGLKAGGLIGHSIGELVAATLSGVFDLATAIEVVLTRGRVMQKQAAGSMLAVEGVFEEIKHLLDDNVVLSAQNTPLSFTLSGEDQYIEKVLTSLKEAEIHCTKLNTSHAFHSPMMVPAEQAFIRALENISLSKPKLPFISCVTGDWITDEQATDIRYWARQIVAPVRFKDGIDKVKDWSNLLVIDCGPKRVASHLLSQCLEEKADISVFACLAKPGQANETERFMLNLAELWATGKTITWKALIDQPLAPLGFLPPYAFNHKEYVIEPSSSSYGGAFTSQHNSLNNLTFDEIHQIQQELRLQFLNNSTVNTLNVVSNLENTKPIDPFASHELNETVSSQQAPDTYTHKDSDTMTTQALTHLKNLFSDTSGIDLRSANPDATFFELGLDSLFLTQLALKLKKTLKSKITFRQLMNEFSSFNKLAQKLQDEGAFADISPAAPANIQNTAPQVQMSVQANQQTVQTITVPSTTTSTQSPLNHLLAQQIQLVNSQIDLLRQLSNPQNNHPQASHPQANTQTISAQAMPQSGSALQNSPVNEESEAPLKKPFGAGTRINVKRSNELSHEQQENLDKLSQRYNQKFCNSKQFAQENRKQLADPRVVSGFRDKLKEIIYPIVVEKSSGAHLWDIDGNKFIDVTCGFGSNFFGNGADFIRDAISKQLHTGYEIGPQTPLAAKVSKKFCQVTQLERVAFCNTGSEAVLGAIRLARTVTGKDHIVMFENDYHGINDEVIVHRGASGLPLPAAAGVPSEAVANTMILDYGAEASLDYIRNHIDDIAAIVIEPVQSRNPELQPKAFIEALRKLCDEHEMALIFDEVITGFRLHPRGAQGYFNIPADIATYGKVIGGGMPIGVIGGKAEYMDALDGGQWQFGDDSSPEVGVTYFAGTFVRHPLAMAAANAVLDKLIAEPGLQSNLGDKTRKMVEQMNHYAQALKAPIKVVNCQSLFRFKIPQDIAYEELIYILLREKGIHIWDARPCFLTTAHTDEDIAAIVSAFKSALDEMLAMGFFSTEGTPQGAAEFKPELKQEPVTTKPTSFDSSKPPVQGARLGKDPSGKPAWFINDPENPGKFRMIENH